MSEIEFPTRVAGVDMGSNALRFVAVEFRDPEHFEVLESERVPVRLGQHAFRRGYLDPALMRRAVEAVERFRARMNDLGIVHHRAIATSAVRESRNGQELVERIRSRTGIRVETISGAEEGRLVWRAIRSRIPSSDRRWLLADLGGGSVEVSFAAANELLWTESLPLGTVRLLEEIDSGANASTSSLRSLLRAYTDPLAESVRAAGRVDGMIATGGNADTLADLSGVPADPQGIRTLTTSQLRALASQLGALSTDERMTRFALREDRADVILPAAIVYERLAEVGDTDTLIVPGVGLKEGLLLELMDELLSHRSPAERLAREVEEGALTLGRRHGFDEAHARQVTRMSLQLFDELRSLHGLGEAERRLLLAAGLLHDVGKAIAHRRHHRHSRYIIRHADPSGLDRREVELVSLVARYHRAARPKDEHERYAKLDASDRARVEKLAALLRVADALDGDHRQHVHGMTVDASAETIFLHLTGAGDVPIEDVKIGKKGKLFRRVFERRVRVAKTEAGASVEAAG